MEDCGFWNCIPSTHIIDTYTHTYTYIHTHTHTHACLSTEWELLSLYICKYRVVLMFLDSGNNKWKYAMASESKVAIYRYTYLKTYHSLPITYHGSTYVLSSDTYGVSFEDLCIYWYVWCIIRVPMYLLIRSWHADTDTWYHVEV